MGDHSSIEWTEATWNPTTGCDKTSPGCSNCYALTLSKRLKAMGQAKYQRDGDPKTSGPGFGLTIHPDKTRLLRFGPLEDKEDDGGDDNDPGTFDFLGFTPVSYTHLTLPTILLV